MFCGNAKYELKYIGTNTKISGGSSQWVELVVSYIDSSEQGVDEQSGGGFQLTFAQA